MREIILGRSSKLWQAISAKPGIAEVFRHAIGHTQLRDFAFSDQDRVWVFAYSRSPQENATMLAYLRQAEVAEVVYVTSSSTIIASLTKCYEYPHAKKLAEDEVSLMPNGKVLTLGLVVADYDELPGGANVATTIPELADFMLAPNWPQAQGKRAHLLRMVKRPFRHGLERALYKLYAGLMKAVLRKPCLLRPVDLVLSIMNMRWYGYTYLSNQLWTKALEDNSTQR